MKSEITKHEHGQMEITVDFSTEEFKAAQEVAIKKINQRCHCQGVP